MGNPMWLEIATTMATVGAAAATGYAAIKAGNAADAAREAVEITRRPKLHVRLIEHVISEGKPYLYIAVENCGSARAVIQRSDLDFLERDRARGVRQRWHTEPPINPMSKTIIMPGEVIDWKVIYDKKANYETSIEGRILYKKPKDETIYRTLFCRVYDPTTGRYLALKDDPEHERED